MEIYCRVMCHPEYVAHLQTGAGIGTWDCENPYLRSLRNLHSWSQNRFLLKWWENSPQDPSWKGRATFCSMSSTFRASELSSSSICKKPLLWLPCISAALLTPETMAMCCSNHTDCLPLSPFLYFCLLASDLDSQRVASEKKVRRGHSRWERPCLWVPGILFQVSMLSLQLIVREAKVIPFKCCCCVIFSSRSLASCSHWILGHQKPLLWGITILATSCEAWQGSSKYAPVLSLYRAEQTGMVLCFLDEALRASALHSCSHALPFLTLFSGWVRFSRLSMKKK